MTTGIRSTRQRAAISALLDKLDDFRSAQELHDELRRRGEGIGLTTVYRTLQQMAAAGVVDALSVPQPLVSQHLRILKSAGVVAGERSGREVMYRLVDHHLADIVVAAVTHSAEGHA